MDEELERLREAFFIKELKLNKNDIQEAEKSLVGYFETLLAIQQTAEKQHG